MPVQHQCLQSFETVQHNYGSQVDTSIRPKQSHQRFTEDQLRPRSTLAAQPVSFEGSRLAHQSLLMVNFDSECSQPPRFSSELLHSPTLWHHMKISAALLLICLTDPSQASSQHIFAHSTVVQFILTRFSHGAYSLTFYSQTLIYFDQIQPGAPAKRSSPSVSNTAHSRSE